MKFAPVSVLCVLVAWSVVPSSVYGQPPLSWGCFSYDKDIGCVEKCGTLGTNTTLCDLDVLCVPLIPCPSGQSEGSSIYISETYDEKVKLYKPTVFPDLGAQATGSTARICWIKRPCSICSFVLGYGYSCRPNSMLETQCGISTLTLGGPSCVGTTSSTE